MAFARKRVHEKQKKAFIGAQLSKQKIGTHYQWKMSNPSGNILKRPGFWSANETENLIIFLEEGFKQDNIFKQNVSDYMPERTGKMCYDRYRYLKTKKDPRILALHKIKNKQQKPYLFNQNFIPAFTPEQEQDLSKIIYDILGNGDIVTVEDISQIALTMYYSPLCLAIKALFISHASKKESIFDKNNNINTDEFGEQLEELFELASNEPQKIIENFSIKEFKASKSWVYRFMLRHNLVFRRPHYERRGKIDPDQVERYLEELYLAIDKYGLDGIVNMDETSVLTYNFPQKVIAPKGSENVKIIKENINTKESTTFIGSITMNPNKRIPLAVVAKGKTAASEKKYGVSSEDDEFITHSESGWVTPAVMISYLKWLKKKVEMDEFALVLDVYKSHVAPSVKKEAAKLGIQLIFVPACATGLLQPLDRRIFGVVKQRLVQFGQKTKESDGKQRWKNLTAIMMEIWDNISDSNINSSWDIPNLDRLILPSDEERDDDDWEIEEEDKDE